MKIRTDQVELLQQQENAKKQQKVADGFGQLLSQEMGRSDAAPKIHAAVPPPGAGAVMFNPLAQADAVGKVDAVQAGSPVDSVDSVDSVDQIAGSLGSMLSQMDKYSQQIGAQPEADLKGAFATLEKLSGELSVLKERNPDIAERAPELGAVVNELEVMTVTERFKINRGDYIA